MRILKEAYPFWDDRVTSTIISFLELNLVGNLPGNNFQSVISTGLVSMSRLFSISVESQRMMLIEMCCMTLKLVICEFEIYFRERRYFISQVQFYLIQARENRHRVMGYAYYEPLIEVGMNRSATVTWESFLTWEWWLAEQWRVHKHIFSLTEHVKTSIRDLGMRYRGQNMYPVAFVLLQLLLNAGRMDADLGSINSDYYCPIAKEYTTYLLNL